MRHLPHHDTLPWHTAVPPAGSRRAVAAPGLEPLRHRPLRVSTEKHDARATRGGLPVVLQDAVLTRFDLATTPGGLERSAVVPRRVVPLQAIQPAVVCTDSNGLGGAVVEPAGEPQPPAASAVSQTLGVTSACRCVSCRECGACRCMNVKRRVLCLNIRLPIRFG